MGSKWDKYDGIDFPPPYDPGATKEPVCVKCGTKLKGKVPADATDITCFFCDNPRGEQDDDANIVLRSTDVPNARNS